MLISDSKYRKQEVLFSLLQSLQFDFISNLTKSHMDREEKTIMFVTRPLCSSVFNWTLSSLSFLNFAIIFESQNMCKE